MGGKEGQMGQKEKNKEGLRRKVFSLPVYCYCETSNIQCIEPEGNIQNTKPWLTGHSILGYIHWQRNVNVAN